MVVVSLGLLGAGQLPLAPAPGAGQSVTPALEGWYENPDGTYSLSFGYFNRNTEEELDIPIGPNNRFEPGTPDRGQPTHFLPRRQRGAFTVTVPADFGGSDAHLDAGLSWPDPVRPGPHASRLAARRVGGCRQRQHAPGAQV